MVMFYYGKALYIGCPKSQCIVNTFETTFAVFYDKIVCSVLLNRFKLGVPKVSVFLATLQVSR